MSIQKHLNTVKEFRQAVGLPISSQPEPLPESIACTVEELAEQADAIGDTLVTALGIALQCTDESIIDDCIEFASKTSELSEEKGFNVDFIMDEIQAANLSKLCKNWDESIETVEYYSKLGVKSEGVKTESGLIAVYCTEAVKIGDKEYPKGKLLKNINWRSPAFNAGNIRKWFTNEDMLKVFGL